MAIKVPNNIKALIFDLDGTIADTMPTHYKACQIVCERHGFEFPLDLFYKWAGRPTNHVFRDLVALKGVEINGDTLGEEKESIYRELIPEIQPVQPVLDLAMHYHEKIPMAIGTGGDRQTAYKTLEALSIKGLFGIIVTKDDVSNYKPHPETFTKAADYFNVSYKDCMVFEDGELGIEAANAAEMYVLDVRTLDDYKRP